MMKTAVRIVLGVIILSALGVLLPVSVTAEVPSLINYQGKLTDGLGDPVNGELEVTFSIYTVASDGGAVWSEVRAITVTDGIFNILLGAANPLKADLFSAYRATYLGLKVGSDSEMTPRQEIASVAYSLKTAGINLKEDRIGIGTDDPGEKLTVSGNIAVSGYFKSPAWPTFHAYNNSGGNQSTTGVWPGNVTLFNNGGHYSTSTYRFTAPVNGYYHFSWSAYTNTLEGRTFMQLNGENVAQTNGNGKAIAMTLYMKVGDYVQLCGTASSAMTWYGAAAHNSFSGHLVCAQ